MEPTQQRTMQCPACDGIVSTQALACPHCGHPLKNTIASPPVRASEIKSTGTAIVLSFLWTGLGQLYAGCIARGIILMILTPIIWSIAWFGGFVGLLGSTASLVQTTYNPAPAGAGGVGIMGILLAFAGVAWWIWGMVDAKNLCEAFNRHQATGDGSTLDQQSALQSRTNSARQAGAWPPRTLMQEPTSEPRATTPLAATDRCRICGEYFAPSEILAHVRAHATGSSGPTTPQEPI